MADTAAAAEGTRKTSLTDSLRAAFAGEGSVGDKARRFAKERPWSAAMLAGVIGIATLSTLKRR